MPCNVLIAHITASVFINDDDWGLHAIPSGWKSCPPHEPISRYRPNRTCEACPERSRRDNGDAHLKRQVTGREVVVAITDGRFDFGPWEQIFCGESDGRRRKRVLVKIVGE